MYRLVFAVFTLSAIAIILVVTAGPSPTAEARFIRWDCSDWQPYPAVADADDELASSILETLAANRGKTLYCGLDQSDTWTKRQVYDNAHAHNDRDRTQYDGSQGQGRFRGFTAGQEGWLTDGEAGITGVSPERIFEFPEQERGRRRTRIIRADVGRGPAETWDANYCYNHHQQTRSGEAMTPNGTLICSDLHPAWTGSSWITGFTNLQHAARNRYVGKSESDNGWRFDWRTRARTFGTQNPAVAGGSSLSEDQWIAKSEAAAKRECKALGGGYKYERGTADFGMGHSDEVGGGINMVEFMGNGHGWYYDYRRQSEVTPGGSANHYQSKARESRTWSATCFKKVRGSRRR